MRENKSLLTVSKPSSPSLITSPSSSNTLSVPPKSTSDRYLMPTPEIYPSKATMSRRTSSDTQSPSQSDTSASAGAGTSSSRTPSIANGYAGGKLRLEEPKMKTDERRYPTVTTAPQEDLDVQSVINERRPSKLKTHDATGASTTPSIASDQYSAMMRGEGYSHIYVTTEDRSDEVPSPCGNASESTGTGSLSVAGSLSAVASLSVAVSASAVGSVSNGSVNDNGSRSGNGSGSGSAGGVHIGEGGAIGSDVRIYVDDTDSASSSNGQRRGGRLRDDETLDASTTVSSATTMRNGRGSGGTDESKETSERPSSTGGSLDPS